MRCVYLHNLHLPICTFQTHRYTRTQYTHRSSVSDPFRATSATWAELWYEPSSYSDYNLSNSKYLMYRHQTLENHYSEIKLTNFYWMTNHLYGNIFPQNLLRNFARKLGNASCSRNICNLSRWKRVNTKLEYIHVSTKWRFQTYVYISEINAKPRSTKT